MAFAVIRIAAIEREAGQPMEAHYQLLRTTGAGPVVFHLFCRGLYVCGMVMEVLDDAKRGQIADIAQCSEDRVAGATGRAGGILRVHRNDEQTVATLLAQPMHSCAYRRPAVA